MFYERLICSEVLSWHMSVSGSMGRRGKNVLSDRATSSISLLGLMMDKHFTRPKDVWESLQIERSTASTLLTRLESLDLVERVGYANWRITRKGIREYVRHTEMLGKVLQRVRTAAIDVKEGDVLSFLHLVGSIDTDGSLAGICESLDWQGDWSRREESIVFDTSFPPGFQILFEFQIELNSVYVFSTMMKGDPDDSIQRTYDCGREVVFVTLLGNVNQYLMQLDAVARREGGNLMITEFGLVDLIEGMFWGKIDSAPWFEWPSRLLRLSRMEKAPLNLDTLKEV